MKKRIKGRISIIEAVYLYNAAKLTRLVMVNAQNRRVLELCGV